MELNRRCVAGVLAAVALVGCSGGEDPAPESTGPVEPEAVEFTTEDGITLHGQLFEPAEPFGLVIMAHQQGGSMDDFAELAREFADDGMAAFPFNFRGYGGQEGEADANLDLDLAAAVAVMRERGFEQIGLLGAGSGATAALHHAQNDDVAKIVALSPAREFAGMRVQPEEIEEPVWFLTDMDDQPYRRDTEFLSERMPNGHRPLTIVNGHGMDMIANADPQEQESLKFTIRIHFAGVFAEQFMSGATEAP